MLHAIDGFALSVDCTALLDDLSFAQSSQDRTAQSVDCGVNDFARTTDSAVLSIVNNHADLRNSVYNSIGQQWWINC